MKNRLLMFGLAMAVLACAKKKSETVEETVSVMPQPLPHQANDAEKQLIGNWLLDSSLAYEQVHDSVLLKDRKIYSDPLNCRINFTSQAADASNFIVEDGLKCAIVKKAWHIESGGQLMIDGSDWYPYHTITGARMLFVQFGVDSYFTVKYYLHKN